MSPRTDSGELLTEATSADHPATVEGARLGGGHRDGPART